MSKKRYKSEDIIRILREVKVMINQDVPTKQACSQLGITDLVLLFSHNMKDPRPLRLTPALELGYSVPGNELILLFPLTPDLYVCFAQACSSRTG